MSVFIVCLVVPLLAKTTRSLLVYECHVLFNILNSFGKLSHMISGDWASSGLPPHLAMVPEELRHYELTYPLHVSTRMRRKHARGKRPGIHVEKKKARAQKKPCQVAAAARIDNIDTV